MNAALQILHWLAGLIILAEALNKLERTTPCAPGLMPHARLVDSLKALAWALLAIGGAVAFFRPFFDALQSPDVTWPVLKALALWKFSPAEAWAVLVSVIAPCLTVPGLSETAIAVGFGVLIVRTRVKEG